MNSNSLFRITLAHKNKTNCFWLHSMMVKWPLPVVFLARISCYDDFLPNIWLYDTRNEAVLQEPMLHLTGDELKEGDRENYALGLIRGY